MTKDLPDTPDEAMEHTTVLLKKLNLYEKVRLLTGRDFWSTWPIDRIGLRSIVVSDGPSGVRGPVWDERSPSLNLPSGSALSATWDRDMAHRYGAAAAVEARRKGVDVVLGPTINLHRSPLGGRHFEAFSEDPVLTADLAASYVTGMQGNGVGATLKHYIANDAETDRFLVDNILAERPLRELYLLAFEKAIVQAGAWAVMSSYNSVNGVTMSEHDLLNTPLHDEWGFDGLVISDWTAVRSIAAADAEQDLVMPGPDGPWGEALVAAVREGRIAESTIDRKVLRILGLARRVGALGDAGTPPPVDAEDGRAFARAAAAAGTVLLENRGELPWTAAALHRIAVVGNNADVVRTQGGGSATVLPERVVSPLEGIRAALPHADVQYEVGAVTQTTIVGFDRSTLKNPVTGGAGAHVAFLDAEGHVVFAEDRFSTDLVWFGGVPISQTRTVRVDFIVTPARSEEVELGFTLAGRARLWLDDELTLDEFVERDHVNLGAALMSPGTRTVRRMMQTGVGIRVRFELTLDLAADAIPDALAFTVGARPVDDDPDALIAEAAGLARSSDVVVVVVGTTSAVESEGFDRTELALPGRQDDLVSAVAAANPRTVVVVNAGAPVLMPWRAEVAAVLVGWFGGEQAGSALADVLTGAVEPGGRLPTTWPAAQHDVPVLSTTPTNGALHYDEGLHIGYRAWLAGAIAPAYWFGHGLGYTRLVTSAATAPATVAPGTVFTVLVVVANTGDRDGKHVIQIYAERPDSSVERAARWLVGFAAVHVVAGGAATVGVPVDARLLAHWDAGWITEPGAYTLRVGASAVDLPVSVTLVVDPS